MNIEKLEKLEKISELRQKGILTEKEFNREKQKVLYGYSPVIVNYSEPIKHDYIPRTPRHPLKKKTYFTDYQEKSIAWELLELFVALIITVSIAAITIMITAIIAANN